MGQSSIQNTTEKNTTLINHVKDMVQVGKQPVYVEASDGGAYKTFSRGNEVEACVEDEIW